MAHYTITDEANQKNIKLADNITSANSNYDTSILTYYRGKIYQGYGAHKEDVLVDVEKYYKKQILGASGKTDEARKIDIFSEKMKGMIENAEKHQAIVDANPGLPLSSIFGAVGSPLIEHDFASVRRVNYLTAVKGIQYALEVYNAPNAVTITPTSEFYLKGFTRSTLLQGQQSIGDDVVPDIAKNSFGTFDVDLYADSFHYALSLRDRQTSVFTLEQQYTQDVPGIFARMKDAKIITLIAALSTTGGNAWDTYTSDHFTNDAGIDVSALESSLMTYGGCEGVIWPLKTGAVYTKNLGGFTTTSPNSTVPSFTRVLGANPRVTAVENDGVGTGKGYFYNKRWATLYQGPEILIAYQNRMTPGQLEGRIQFDFNKANTELTGAIIGKTGLNS